MEAASGVGRLAPRDVGSLMPRDVGRLAPRVVGRLAPSPTGAQHVGNARTYLLAWLSIRSCGGRLLLRIEDLDSPRVKVGADAQAIEDLSWLGLDWDEGPDCPGALGPYVQSERVSLYEEALRRLQSRELVYPCDCTRNDILSAASAPHAGEDGVVYPGTCRRRIVKDADNLKDKPFAWRFRMPQRVATIDDGFMGKHERSLDRDLGDFVVYRSDGTPAYQLAVVVDDHAMGVTEVLRGADLLPSAFRQQVLFEALELSPPRYIHVPLVVGEDGRRLAKRHGDTRLSTLRKEGVPPERLVGWLAWSCGLIERPEPVRATDLIPKFDLAKIPHVPIVFGETTHRELVSGATP